MSAQEPTAITESPEQLLYDQLNTLLSKYLDSIHIDQVFQAYQYGAKHHSGQFRKSGEAYICHPLSVAISLAHMRMDVHGVMAAILHDLIEDTDVTKTDILELFGEDVAELVDGVTKLTQLNCKTQAEAQAENVRKMCLAMARDMRVIMVKLADRLHNMRTLGVMRPDKKRRIAKETLDIYTPIANRLGMNDIRHQLESLCFEAMYPMRHRILKNAVKKSRGNRKEIIETITVSLKTRLHQAHVTCDVKGREKYLYSIYKKMLSKKLSFSDIYDVYAFRIHCEDVDTCYRVLGIVHNLFKPIPGKFKDYIALPKANGYQSLHTIIIGPYGVPVEIQIRTHQMHRMSESGIAAHWLYKSDDEEHIHSKTRATEWVRDLLEIQKTAGNSLEFIDNLKIDLFPQEIFVFTPQGSIIKLPRKSSIVDFAYAVHTDIGNSCVSARIDKRLVPLQTQLENGVTVEVITATWARPNPLWLNYVVTTKARTGIRSYLKHFKQKEAISLGRRLLEKELQDINKSLTDITEQMQDQLLQAIQLTSMDELLEEIGLGNKMPFLIATQLNQEDISAAIKLEDTENRKVTQLIIKGTEGMVVTIAKCCRPIPGDPIIGYFNPGKGIVVHHHECRNSADGRKKSTDWLEVEWSQDATGDYPTEIRLELLNQPGTLATIASTISKMDSNIESVNISTQDARVSVDFITLTVKDRVHLANIMRQLKKLFIVLKITHTRG
ncbi:bifunctional GTP diphosphokinase/guanosine-3',5'-bis(diphosphate) 3'-diphosphatase [Methylococcaceae bacterium HT1]|nr:bifunctional GTP diphosphokinase/guanosine-3',5'-bis(diphosphate) 3'-diphosphatase [Methylococcaceae bacterium HT1]TXL18666.1 bifunctional GTP diphosphokinase/guanosine-3',5'-bis(diphosphate) 3'-diphosphatase [Methylococcaceae bacterium HT3]TXL23803.1 bifunctional GTP diphosphokinase/guanosine-3',5'-bis(diphosphate) 3'-diphosphatase [Methylococcaceae bacterium HT2]TXL23808.1 bifunctional GTP diphosphokinase/guanosine-3',5'-bis(diphosphate) 3'-diphosphatase [Methylococcaceae bacterium HT2]